MHVFLHQAMKHTTITWQYEKKLSPSEWDQFVYSNRSGTWFHSYEAFLAIWNRHPEFILGIDQETNEQVVGFMFYPGNKIGITYPKRHSLLYFSSPVFHDKINGEWMQILPQISRFFSFSIMNSAYQELPVKRVGKGYSCKYGLWLPIEPSEHAQWNKLSEGHTRHLKNKLKNEIEWVQPTSLTIADLKMVEMTYLAHARVAPFSPAHLHEIIQKLPEGRLWCCKYSVNEKIAGWRLWIVDPRGWLVDWVSAVDRSVKEQGIGHHLVWDSINKARTEGLKAIDFSGANTPGISEFKARFGADTRYGYYYRHTKTFFHDYLLKFDGWLKEKKRVSGIKK